jgi:uncharacterized protein YijF (DUF1287 family)
MKNEINILLFILLLSCNDLDYVSIDLNNKDQLNFINSVLDRTKHKIRYNGSYFDIDYPNGDIPSNFGVCTDVIIRSYRKIGVDLQKLIHEDIKNNFYDYPISKHWPDQRYADSNIDHRRVPNLEVFFSKYGESLSTSNINSEFKPGDIVTWDLKGSSPWHIGIVINRLSSSTNRPMIVHNIGQGPIIDDAIFDFPIRGHYRYLPFNN